MSDDTTPSDKDVLDATGRHPDEWFAFLDAQGATQWSREGIGEWLSGALAGVDSEWSDAIAANYRKARGLF